MSGDLRFCEYCDFAVEDPARLRCPSCGNQLYVVSSGIGLLVAAVVGALLTTTPFFFSGTRLSWLAVGVIGGPVIELFVILIAIFNKLYFRTRYGGAIVPALMFAIGTILLAGYCILRFIPFGGAVMC